MPSHLVIVEDSLLVRKGLLAIVKGLLEQPGGLSADPHATEKYEIVADVASARELQSLLAEQPIDLVLLDYSLDTDDLDTSPLHKLDGHALIKWVRKQYPATRIITVSSHSSPVIIRMVFEAGAIGYVSKGATEVILGQAIISAMKNEAYIEPRFLKEMLHKKPLEISVSPREMEVLRLIGKGMRLTDIAQQLHLSVKTVSAHKVHAMEKLGVSSDVELYRLTMAL